jgi:hypothetical protein
MNRVRSCDSAHYRIRVRGLLPPEWSEWFGGLTISHEAGGDTVLAGSVDDQAALHGLISRIRDLGLTLIAIERIDLDPLDRSQQPD